MRDTLEREVKLKVGRGFRLPELPGEPLPSRTFTSTYYDTSEYVLAHAGITLRRRIEKRKGLWQLKLLHGAARLELESSGGGLGPPLELKKLLFVYLCDHDLFPVAKLRALRRGIRVNGLEGPLANVTIDSVALLEGNRVTRRFSELGIKLVGGDEKDLQRIEAALRQAGAQDGDPRPKVFKALGLQFPAVPEPPASTAPAIDHLVAKLQDQVRAILGHDPGTRLGSDPEDLHQMRVATRRLREFLRAARPMLIPEWGDSLRDELSWLGQALGAVRDSDVLLEHFNSEATSLDPQERKTFHRLLSRLERERAAARVDILETLESDRYLKLVERLKTAAQEPQVVLREASLPGYAAEAFRKLRKAVRKAESDSSEAALHRIRIRCKRARYSAELAEAAVGKPASRYIQQLKGLQDLLGEHQDAIVAEAWLDKALARTRGVRTAFIAGRIVERFRRRRRKARSTVRKIWPKLERRGKKTWPRLPDPKVHRERTMTDLLHSTP